jgi:aryl-alcohol dehydrogenase-like predicted oxidoreductase
MGFGEDVGWGTSVDLSMEIIARFLDQGGNFIDTANGYTMGHSEVIIGGFLKSRPGLRDRVVLATKFSNNFFPGDPNGGGSNRKSVMAACDESLRRLQLDYIDLYWLHYWDKFTPIDETMRALDDLVSTGKVRYIGVSDTPAWKVSQAQTTADFRGWAPFISMQVEYSLLERTIEGELVPAAGEFNLGITPYASLGNGSLTGKYTRANAGQLRSHRGDHITGRLGEREYDIIDVLISVADELGTTPAAVARAWVRDRPGITSTIIGVTSMEQLEKTLGTLDLSLSAEQTARLDEVSKPTLNFPYDFVTGGALDMCHGGATVNGEKSGLFRPALENPY